MKVIYENLDDYRYEIEDNRRDMDIYKNSIDNSNIDIEDDINNCSSKIAYNKISNTNREIKVIRYNRNGSHNIDCTNIENMYMNIRVIYDNCVYNCKRGATTDSPRRCYK